MNERVAEPKGLRFRLPFSGFFRGLIGRKVAEQVKTSEPEWLRLTLSSSYFDVRVDKPNGDPAATEKLAWGILATFVTHHGLKIYGVNPDAHLQEGSAEPLSEESIALFKMIDTGVTDPPAVRPGDFHKPSQDINSSHELPSQAIVRERCSGVIIIERWEPEAIAQPVREPEHV